MFNLNNYLNEQYRFGLGNERRELLLQGNVLYDRFRYRLKDDDIPSLCNFLATCEVWSLDVCYNRITDKGLCTLVKYIKESSHEFISVNLMCNDISSVGVQALCDVGSDLKIKSLRLNGNKFGSEGGKALSTLLLNNDYLQHLDIGETDQNIESIVYITAVLRNSDTKLRSLNLSRPLIKFSEAHAAEVLGQMLFMNVSLKELILEKFGLVDHDIELMAAGLQKYMHERFVLPTADPQAFYYKEAKSCSSYETVTSIEKYMKDRGLLEQMKADAPSENLPGEENASEEEKKNAGDHETTRDSQEIETEKLAETNSLHSIPGDTQHANEKEYIHITQCEEIDANPLQRVIACGSFVSYLRHLDLSCNHLSDYSIGYLGPYLQSKPPLVILNLAFNLIGDEGALELSRYLPSTIIEVLDISHNTIDPDGIQNLVYRLKRPSTMRKLYIWGNRLDNDVCKYLREVVESGNISQENIDLKIYQIDGIDYAAFNQECEDIRSEYYCVRKIPLHVYSHLSPCMQRLKEAMEQTMLES